MFVCFAKVQHRGHELCVYKTTKVGSDFYNKIRDMSNEQKSFGTRPPRCFKQKVVTLSLNIKLATNF